MKDLFRLTCYVALGMVVYVTVKDTRQRQIYREHIDKMSVGIKKLKQNF